MNIEEIHIICLKYNITNYTINDDLSIDVNGSVNLFDGKLEELPLKFRNVTGHFDCSINYLKSLEGSPNKVGGTFFCYDNPLVSIKGITLNLPEKQLYLPNHFTYSDYVVYCNSYRRDSKFKKILK